MSDNNIVEIVRDYSAELVPEKMNNEDVCLTKNRIDTMLKFLNKKTRPKENKKGFGREWRVGRVPNREQKYPTKCKNK